MGQKRIGLRNGSLDGFSSECVTNLVLRKLHLIGSTLGLMFLIRFARNVVAIWKIIVLGVMYYINISLIHQLI